ncbi:MAG: SLC13 family permease [Candidatus Nezhaarchaeales archaeon]
MTELLALALFLATIGLMIWGPIERSVIGGVGVVAMLLLGVVSPLEAFSLIDWNVLAILAGLWIASTYLVAAKMPEALASAVLKRTRSLRHALFALAFAAGIVTMFVDNVLVVLLFCPIVMRLCRLAKVDPLLPTVLVGLAANFMGVGLLLGDITPQMLHSVAGAEFIDFVIFRGRPGSFFVLLATFVIVLAIYFSKLMRWGDGVDAGPLAPALEAPGQGGGALKVSLLFFVGIVVLMSLRKAIGAPLGAIALSGALVMACSMELLRKAGWLRGVPPFEEVLGRLEWRALLYYASLFILVGCIERAGHIDALARSMQPLLLDVRTGVPALYWLSAGVASIVQFDAYNLAMFYTLRELSLANGLDAWPYYWSVAWASTLASEATVVSAPALYVVWTLIEKEGYRVTTKSFHSITVRFAALSLLVNFAIAFPLLSTMPH